ALTSCSRLTGVMVTLAASSAFFAAVPHGTCSAQSATLTPGLVRSDSPVIPFGLPFGTAMTSWLRTNVMGVPSPLPASVTVFMFAGAAEANTSAGAPWSIWVASAELPAKLNVTFDPGLAASNFWPIVLNDWASEAGATRGPAPVPPLPLADPLVSGLEESEPPPHPDRPTSATDGSASGKGVTG